MATVEGFSNSKVGLEVDETFGAGRMSLRPIDYKQWRGHIGGHYRMARSTGLVTGVAAAGALLSFRWNNADRAALLLRVIAHATLTTAFAAAQETSIDLVKMSAMPASDSGGTAIDLVNDNRLSHFMQRALVTDLRIADAAALGAGAGNVAEGNALAAAVFGLGNTAGASAQDVLFDAIAGQEHPIELSAGTGFRIRNLFAQGAAGVVRFTFSLVWAEVPSRFY